MDFRTDFRTESEPRCPARTDEITKMFRAALGARAQAQIVDEAVADPTTRVARVVRTPAETPEQLLRRSRREHRTGSYYVLSRD